MNEELEDVKAHLKLCSTLFKATCEGAEIDTAGTKVVVKVCDESVGARSLDELFVIWEKYST